MHFIFLCYLYDTRIYSYVTRMLSVHHLYATHMYFMSYIYHSHGTHCTRMSFVYHSYLLVCHPYVTRMSLVCIRMLFVDHLYVVLPWTFLGVHFKDHF